MRQRTLGFIAVALLAGGTALGVGTGIVAYRMEATSGSAITERIPAHRQQPGPGYREPGFRQPAGGPGRRSAPGGGV